MTPFTEGVGPLPEWAGGYALLTFGVRSFASFCLHCKQNQQGYALLTFGVQSFASLLTFGVQWSILVA